MRTSRITVITLDEGDTIEVRITGQRDGVTITNDADVGDPPRPQLSIMTNLSTFVAGQATKDDVGIQPDDEENLEVDYAKGCTILVG